VLWAVDISHEATDGIPADGVDAAEAYAAFKGLTYDFTQLFWATAIGNDAFDGIPAGGVDPADAKAALKLRPLRIMLPAAVPKQQ
jgi:hypothetical protein